MENGWMRFYLHLLFPFPIAVIVFAGFVLFLVIREDVVFGSLLGSIKDGNKFYFGWKISQDNEPEPLLLLLQWEAWFCLFNDKLRQEHTKG